MDGMDGKPVKVGDIVELDITSKGSKGDGLGHVEGLVIFVEGAEVGKKYHVKITRVNCSVAFGQIAGEE